MPEHTIPETLIENIRSGRAALVVGAGIGVPTWKQLLERMNQLLAERGEVGDDAAARDVEKLLHKGSLVRASGFLGRTLGEEACDRVVREMWSRIPEIPPVARALASLPFRQVWTTFPGDVVERALVEHSPDGWPSAKVLTYRKAGEIDRRRRTVLKILGDLDSYVVTPRSIRKALTREGTLRDHLRPYYAEGSLVFVGFRYGDPDLAGLLDRVFGAFEPPQSDHFLVASGVGPVTVDELQSEHDINVINLAGKGTDERATEALLEFLEELRRACEAATVTLLQMRPDPDDLEGWLAVLHEDPFDDEAAQRLASIEARATEAGDWERLVEVLMARVETEGSAPGRAALLRQVADVFETRIGDLPRAFTALTAALREDPADPTTLDGAEKLAADTDAWAELVADVSSVAREIEDKEIAASFWARAGRWYHKQLGHHDYAMASFREAIKLDPGQLEARRGLIESYRVLSRWAEMADELAELVEREPAPGARVDLYLALGDLCESQLAATSRAVDAYQKAADLDADNDDTLAALERLYRKGEHWGKLAKVLERRAELYEAAGEAARAAATRRELATMRAERLGDLEGAIARYEAALRSDDRDLAALRALEELYDKVGRTADYLGILERLCDVVAGSEKGSLLRRLAAESEDRAGGPDQAIAAYERVLVLEPTADDAFRALERLTRSSGRWDKLVEVLGRHAETAKAPALKAEQYAAMADVLEGELSDPHRAIEAHKNALGAMPERRASFDALGRLYQRTGDHPQAMATFERAAQLAGPQGADLWAAAGRIAMDELADPEIAAQHFDRALALDEGHLPSLLAMARLARAQASWATAVKRLGEAAHVSTSRREKIELLLEAAELHEHKLDDGDAALGLLLKVLELEPENLDAGARAAARLTDQARWQEALPIAEMLARKAEGDRLEKARREAELGRIARALRHLQKAGKHYRAAVEADGDSLDAALGLAEVLYTLAREQGGEERWVEVDQRHRDVLARHRTRLADGQVVELWHRLGVTARELGDDKKAEASFRRALERDPNHAPTLDALVELAEAAGDWKAVVDAKRELLEGASDEERARLYDQIGDLLRGKLGDPAGALGAYLEAVKLRPGNLTLLHKTLEVHTAQKQWRQAVETLGAIAESETEPRRRAKYHYAAAVIARDELEDAELAVDRFAHAVDDDPTMPKAFDAIDQLLSDKGDWKGLARQHRRMLKRLGDDAPAEQLLRLWSRLGDICADHLADGESAIAAYEVAVSIAPDDVERHEHLANLYLEAGPSRRQDAIAELQFLIAAQPDRVELYRALSTLYREEGELDKAFCLAQALVFLKAATPEEAALFEKARPPGFVLGRRRLTEELWQKAILHPGEDRHISAIFASMVGGIAGTTAQPPTAFNLSPRDRVDLDKDGHLATRVFRYASTVLAIDPEPQLYWADGDGFRVANTADKGKLSPSVLAGAAVRDKDSERELAFELGKRLAYLRPERYVNYALGSLPRLETAFYGALAASGYKRPDDVDAEAAKMAGELERAVPSAVLDQVASIAKKMGLTRQNGVVAGWRTATDLTANRVGLILCNDLETAARLVAVESGAMSTLPVKERLRDLLAYSVSEGYFQVRKHMGLALTQ
jgi:golgin subfamily B member 1